MCYTFGNKGTVMKKYILMSICVSTVMTTGVFASTLEIYQDGAKYRMIPTDRFIGLTKRVDATCDGQSLLLSTSGECSETHRLCKEQSQLSVLENEKNSLLYASETLEKLVTISKPTEIDAGKWIEAATKIGKQKALLASQEKTASQKLQAATAAFFRQAPSRKPLFMQKKCVGELELTLPAGYIGAKLLYEADTSDPNAIGIKQFIALSNHSGIDIVAKEADIYAKSYRIYLRPQQFNPWIARIRKDLRLRKSMKKEKMAYAEPAMVNAGMGADAAPVEPVSEMGAVVQTGYKNYHISGIELPSTGEEIKVKIADYTTPAECAYVSYPYRDQRVYRACSFQPQSPIESNRWRIQKDKRLVSDQAYGEYRDGTYRLNVDIDDEVLVQRKPMVKKDRSSGIFGGSIRKKDGFELDITNIAATAKKITIIERIPTSTTDKIEIKLLSVEGASSHRLLADGRLEIEVALAPKKHQKIKVLFELRYDKDTKVSY
jgi:hypothetical protein